MNRHAAPTTALSLLVLCACDPPNSFVVPPAPDAGRDEAALDGGAPHDAAVIGPAPVDAGQAPTLDAGAVEPAIDAGPIDPAPADAGPRDVPDAGTPPVTLLLEDGFEHHAAERWLDGSAHAAWRSLYDGHGGTWIERDETIVLSQSPQASTRLDETHASLVLADPIVSGDFQVGVRMRTVAQLRTPIPNAWEVAWIVWHYVDEGHFYYFVPKPNGWELGKVDSSRVDASGPACVWPEYLNCRYPGAQRFLATGAAPAFPAGPWYDVTVKQRGATITIWVDDREIVAFTDDDAAYTSGRIGLYNEDAHVHFDDVRLIALPPE